jgi:hypothetical protein
MGPVKPVRKSKPFKAGSPVSAKPVRKGAVTGAVAKKKQMIDMKKTIDKKTASEKMKKVQLEQMKKSVAKKPARKSLGGGTSRRASY